MAKSTNQPINQPNNQSNNEWMNAWMNQSINQTINQPNNQTDTNFPSYCNLPSAPFFGSHTFTHTQYPYLNFPAWHAQSSGSTHDIAHVHACAGLCIELQIRHPQVMSRRGSFRTIRKSKLPWATRKTACCGPCRSSLAYAKQQNSSLHHWPTQTTNYHPQPRISLTLQKPAGVLGCKPNSSIQLHSIQSRIHAHIRLNPSWIPYFFCISCSTTRWPTT